MQRDFNRALEIVERARQRAKGLPQRMKSETISSDGSRTIVEVTLEDAPPAEQDVTP